MVVREVGCSLEMALSLLLFHRPWPSTLQDGWEIRMLVSSVTGAASYPPAGQFQSPNPPSGGQITRASGSGQLWALEGSGKHQQFSHLPSLAGLALPAPSSMPQTALAVRCVAPKGPVLGIPLLQPLPRSHQRYKRPGGVEGIQCRTNTNNLSSSPG